MYIFKSIARGWNRDSGPAAGEAVTTASDVDVVSNVKDFIIYIIVLFTRIGQLSFRSGSVGSGGDDVDCVGSFSLTCVIDYTHSTGVVGLN